MKGRCNICTVGPVEVVPTSAGLTCHPCAGLATQFITYGPDLELVATEAGLVPASSADAFNDIDGAPLDHDPPPAPVRDWPAILVSGHPLAQPGALVLDQDVLAEGVEAWVTPDSVVALEVDSDGRWTADGGDDASLEAIDLHPTALQALAALADRLAAAARALSDRAALCRGGEW